MWNKKPKIGKKEKDLRGLSCRKWGGKKNKNKMSDSYMWFFHCVAKHIEGLLKKLYFISGFIAKFG